MATRWSRPPATTIRRTGLLALVGALMLACSDGSPLADPGTDGSATTSSTVAGSSTLGTLTPSKGSDSELDAVADRAVTDLAGRLGLEDAEVGVILTERVTWPDGRLGCPGVEPYTLEQVDGSRVVLAHGELTYHYHAGSDGLPHLCESITKRTRGPGTPEPSIPPPIK